MTAVAHILGGGAIDEFVASGLVLVGLVWLLRRSERKARRRRQEMEETAPDRSSEPT